MPTIRTMQMMQSLVAISLLAAAGALAQAPKPIIENERVTVWDIKVPARTNMSLKEIDKRDTVIVSLDKDRLGEVEFRPRDLCILPDVFETYVVSIASQ